MEKEPYYGGCHAQYPQTYPKDAEQPRSVVDVALSSPKYSWFEEAQRNKPQSNSLGAALFIVASGGMSLAWSVGFAPSFQNISKGTQTHLQICWFVAVILGATAATVLINKIKKRTFNITASVLVLLNGILFLAASTSIAAITIARYCDGVAFGLTVVPVIMAGSEQSVKNLRGLVLSIESIGISMGIMLQAIYFNLWASDASFGSTQMHGALAILYGLLAFIFACFLTIESPSFYLLRDQDTEAIECLRKLQRPHVVTTETYAIFYEDKKRVEEDAARGMSLNIRNGLIPLVKLCFFRVLVTMSFSLPISLAVVRASEALDDTTDSQVSVVFYGTLRSMGPIVAIFTLDSLGRKYPSAIAMFIGGGIMISVGYIIYTSNHYLSVSELETIIALLLTYQFVAGFFAAASTTYLGEAFSISVKPYFILVTIIFDNIVQVIICCTFNVNANDDEISVFSFVLGALHIVVGLMIYAAMPETKKTTLREALCMFREVISSRK